jgi:methionyl aminopeptidase
MMPPILWLLLLGLGVLGGIWLYRVGQGIRRRREQEAIDRERWTRLPHLLEVLDDVFKAVESEMRPGIRPVDLARFMEELAHRAGVRSSVRNYKGFPAPACISVNDVFLNGVPDHVPIAKGDLVNIQFGVTDGLAYAQQTWAYTVGEPSAVQDRLLQAGVEALERATRVAHGQAQVADVSTAIERAAARYGCDPSRDFVGCGIWERPVEPPQIPCYNDPETGAVRLEPGMVLLVQAILHAGSCEGEVLSDGWAIRSRDRLPAVAMSRMILIDKEEAIPLTDLRTTRVSDSREREGSVF